MKWLICIGILFIIGGIGSIKDNFVVFLISVAVGIIFISAGRNKKKHKKCIKCGKGRMVSYIDEEGYCCDCARARDLARIAQSKYKEEPQKISSLVSHPEQSPSDTQVPMPSVPVVSSVSFSPPAQSVVAEKIVKRSLDSYMRFGVPVKHMYNGISIVYRYPNIPVSNVDRSVLQKMVDVEQFNVELSVAVSGNIVASWNGSIVAHLEDKQSICKDWLSNGLPYICEFAAFGNGKERIALFLYRDDEKRLQSNRFEVTKLTACMSDEKQEVIWFLKQGQKLFVDLDDNSKPYIRDIEYNPIGNLPAKFKNAYFEDEIAGVFFDHAEKTENANGDEKEIPYIKIYFH